MNQDFDPVQNYEESKKAIGYVDRKKATQDDYDRIGFMSGLEVHQQLKTKKKLFCNCPSGIFHKDENFDAEIIRHMRPTLSELGEYDGTALMEFITRKNIIYRINNETACTYEVDDTPPFPLNREALEYALEISILSKLNIVGEVHITRKQYLDGSIPTGFQRTAILGVEGEIKLKHKNIKLIQLSIEEDACREISDIGHWRTYKTDRLGMPLIETVTYPEFVNPDEVKEGADYIRFLNRSTNKVETGHGSTRADVNVSCRGGTRVEIKGVSRIKWMPELTHNEAFRQYALLRIKKLLNEKISDTENWEIESKQLDTNNYKFIFHPLKEAISDGQKVFAVKLKGFHSILSHFTQPSKIFGDEISGRLKVVACLEQPNIIHSEQFNQVITDDNLNKVKQELNAGKDDGVIIFWAADDDVKTALETIEERCKMAFEGVPSETRKSFANGTTIFERVLPGADRMYPDTDSAPIPLKKEYIDKVSSDIPIDIYKRFEQLNNWDVPTDTYDYILKKNLIPLMEKIESKLNISPKFVATLFAHRLKHIEGKNKKSPDFKYSMIYAMLKFLKENEIKIELSKELLLEIYTHPKMDFESILTTIKFKKLPAEEILSKVSFLKEKFKEIRISQKDNVETNWIIGELNKSALGNIELAELNDYIENN
ncbi:MAG: Glu-tRNA(Gln) amidotransferase subunit GatE [Bacteroidota bacterium]|nr:Glu-tRNA(Gln) amidotransferase subunit GatE [Bacteroidota bacterium]